MPTIDRFEQIQLKYKCKPNWWDSILLFSLKKAICWSASEILFEKLRLFRESCFNHLNYSFKLLRSQKSSVQKHSSPEQKFQSTKHTKTNTIYHLFEIWIEIFIGERGRPMSVWFWLFLGEISQIKLKWWFSGNSSLELYHNLWTTSD